MKKQKEYPSKGTILLTKYGNYGRYGCSRLQVNSLKLDLNNVAKQL